jgi:hypothetical protein
LLLKLQYNIHTGPAATAKEYPAIAYPRWFASQISARTPPVDTIGADPKKPHKKRVMRTVCISFADPVAKEKSAAMKHGAIVGHFLP